MKLNIQQFGHGPDLIILHGLFGSGDNWMTIGKQLANQFNMHLVDQRNHGKSIHCNEMSYSLMAEDLKEYLDSIGIKECIIMGHSMGGKTAMQFTADYPEYVKQLIVVDIAPKRYPDHHGDLIDALLKLDLSLAINKTDLLKSLETDIPDIAVRQFLLKNIVRNSENQYEWRMNINGIKENYDKIMAAPILDKVISVPTLFVSGLRSSYIKANDEELINSHFKTVDMISINAGHWLHAELPDEFIRIIVGWMNKK